MLLINVPNCKPRRLFSGLLNVRWLCLCMSLNSITPHSIRNVLSPPDSLISLRRWSWIPGIACDDCQNLLSSTIFALFYYQRAWQNSKKYFVRPSGPSSQLGPRVRDNHHRLLRRWNDSTGNLSLKLNFMKEIKPPDWKRKDRWWSLCGVDFWLGTHYCKNCRYYELITCLQSSWRLSLWWSMHE